MLYNKYNPQGGSKLAWTCSSTSPIRSGSFGRESCKYRPIPLLWANPHTLPMMTSSPETRVPGGAMPSASSLS